MLNLKEEAKFKKLREMSRELKMPPPPEIVIVLKVKDKRGKVLFTDQQRGHSWLRNRYNSMFAYLTTCGGHASSAFGAGYMSAKNQAGTVRYGVGNSVGGNSYIDPGRGFLADVAALSGGIIVGTSNTAWDAEQYNLIAMVAHGNGSGQLAYAASSVGAAVYTGATKSWAVEMKRMMTNNSGAQIDVKETGLVWIPGQPNEGVFTLGSEPVLMDRTVLDPIAVVPISAILTVTYVISMSFSAID